VDGVQDWLARLSPDGAIVAGALRRLIIEAAPGAREAQLDPRGKARPGPHKHFLPLASRA
jgi:hypothetical protein